MKTAGKMQLYINRAGYFKRLCKLHAESLTKQHSEKISVYQT